MNSIEKFRLQLENENTLKEEAVEAYNKIVDVMSTFCEITFLLEGQRNVWEDYGERLYKIRKCITKELPKVIKPILNES